MRARFNKNDSNHERVVWEVSHGKRWWSVYFSTASGKYVVMNERLRDIDPNGKLGSKIIAATQTTE